MIADDDVVFAHELADVATAVSLEYFREDVEVQTKADGSPVSAGDLAVERALIDMVRERRPDDGILTEESGALRDAGRRWIFDPIDGTVMYVDHEPGWGTHVALEIGGEIVLGIVTRPVEGRRYSAVAGRGTYVDDERIELSSVDSLEQTRVGFFAPPALMERVAAAVKEVRKDHFVFVDFLMGNLDAIVCGPDFGAVWDHAPCGILTREAGGRYADPEGGTRIDRRAGLYSNGHIHDALRDVLGPWA